MPRLTFTTRRVRAPGDPLDGQYTVVDAQERPATIDGAPIHLDRRTDAAAFARLLTHASRRPRASEVIEQ